MHLYALNFSGQLQSAASAQKQVDYFCLECNAPVRLREGLERKPHFYHLQTSTSCRQSGKSLTHLQIQLHLEKLLIQEVSLEQRFPSIQRIADVAWHKEKIIFEIQCSPMRRDEMEARVKDYRSLGYQIVWILHDKHYNKWRLSALEMGLKHIPHYFTNITADGSGCIYDQWQWIDAGRRKSALSALPIDLSAPYRHPQPPRNWPLGFQGDLLSLDLKHPYSLKALEKAKEFKQTKNKLVFFSTIRKLAISYFNYLLKKYCN